MTITLPKGSMITINGTALSEHNRGGAKLDYEFIGIKARTLSGTLKRQSIASKRTISVEWERLPAHDSATVDGMAGRNTIKGLVNIDWNNNLTPLTVTYYEVNSSGVQVQTTATMVVDSYNEELVKRFSYQHWNVSLVLVEV